jgi:DNA-binding NarL/FixJ family response regulator
MRSVRVSVIDDHSQSRAALTALLRTHPEISVIADGDLTLMETVRTEPHQPHVLVIDVEPFTPSDFERLSHLSRAVPDMHIIGIGMWLGDRDRVLASGASDFHVKADAPELLLQTILSACRHC